MVSSLESLSSEISSATKEQSLGSGEILHAIEEETHATQTIKEMEQEFDAIIKRFKLE